MAELKLESAPAISGSSRPRTVEEERLYRKQRLAATFRLFARYGFDEGVAGHVTARDPELTDHFWVNPFGQYFGHIRVSDLLLVNHLGDVVQGGRPVNTAAFAIHSQIHAARPDVIAAAHSHSMYGKAWSSLGRLLDPITQDSCSSSQRPRASPSGSRRRARGSRARRWAPSRRGSSSSGRSTT